MAIFRDLVGCGFLDFMKNFLCGLRLWVCNNIVGNLPIPALRMLFYRWFMRFDVAIGSSILPQCRFAKGRGVKIGSASVINNRCLIDNRYGVWIGNSVSISVGCRIYTAGHAIDSCDFHMTGAPVKINDYVWLCADCVVLPGVEIGCGAVVLTGSVVTKNIPPFAVVGGNPCVVLRQRRSDLNYKLNWNPVVPAFG